MVRKNTTPYPNDSEDEELINSQWLKNVGIEAEDDLFQFLEAQKVTRGTLLHPTFAKVVSKLAKSGRISLRVVYILSAFLFDKVSSHSQANKKFILDNTTALKKNYLDHLDIFGLFSLTNNFLSTPLSLTENVVSKSFALCRQSVEFGLFAAEENIRFIEALLGDTETSVVFAEFISLFKREGWDKSIDVQLMLKQNGLFKSALITIKTLLAWIILQLVTRGYSEPLNISTVYCNFDSNVPFCSRSHSFIESYIQYSQPQNFFISDVNLNQHSSLISSLEIKSNPHLNTPNPFHQNSKVSSIQSISFGPRQTSLNFDLNTNHNNTEDNIFLQKIAKTSNVLYQNKDDPLFVSLSDDEWHRRILFTLTAVQSRLSEFESSENSSTASGSELLPKDNNTKSRFRSFFTHRSDSSLSNTFTESQSYTKKKQNTINSQPYNSIDSIDQIQLKINNLCNDLEPDISGKQEDRIHYIDFESLNAFAVGTESAPPSLPSYSPKLDGMYVPVVPKSPKNTPMINTNSDTSTFLYTDDHYDGIMFETPTKTTNLKNDMYSNQYDIYPYKPLLFNIARFATFAISAYGAKFMSVMDLDKGYIDINSLLQKFGDKTDNQSCYSTDAANTDQSDYSSSNYNTDSNSIFNENCSVNGDSLSDTTHQKKTLNSQHLIPFSPYLKSESVLENNTSPLFKQRSLNFDITKKESPLLNLPHCTPQSQNSTPDHSFLKKSSSFCDYKSRNKKSKYNKKYKLKPNHSQKISGDHPNHVAFCNHTGVPLSDLLFSSYVDPLLNKKRRSASRILKTKRYSKKKNSNGRSNSFINKNNYIFEENDISEPSTYINQFYNAFQWPLGIAKTSVNYATSLLPPLFLSQSIPDKTEKVPRENNKKHSNAKLKKNKKNSSANKNLDNYSTNHSYFGDQYILYREPSIHTPVHFIAIDRATKSVVLAIRGTLGVSDFFIDLMCTYKQIVLTNHPKSKEVQFKAHSGMWKSACLMASPKNEVFIEICEALRKFPNYGLVLCGHSLGGGVAALLSILWSKPVYDQTESKEPVGSLKSSNQRNDPKFVTSSIFGLVSDRPIACYSYGSPCVVNSELSSYSQSFIISIINSNDVFSHLSIGSMVDLIAVTTTLEKERKTVEKIVMNAFREQKTSLIDKINPFSIDMSNLGVIYGHDFDKQNFADNSNNSNINSEDSKNCGEDSHNQSIKNNTQLKEKNGVHNPEDKIDANSSDSNIISDGSSNREDKLGNNRQRTSYQVVSDYSALSSERVSSLLNKFNPLNYIPSLPTPYLESFNPFAKNLENWHLSVIKTMRANMDHEKLYPPGLIYVLEQQADGDEQIMRESKQQKSIFGNNLYNFGGLGGGLMNYIFPNFTNTTKKIKLLRCNDVMKSFSELRFAPNMFISHYPQVYEYNIGALIHSHCS
ncbi:hypothetical protein BB561_001306 [Smittium simulii]|uniref:sn-1-specific diacylglycerol lipase n=1 Tax=Smittium simulii TaxID=133385 RepID=A0A2T9YV72_9FUNG|nr:hypothetical protein BB561_001306 [Smittium simulii]